MNSKILRLPKVGRVGIFHEDSGNGSGLPASARPEGHLSAQVIRNGNPLQAKQVIKRWGRFWNNVNPDDTVIDLGSGLVTNVGVLSLANDWNWASPSGAAINTLKLANQHMTGVGTSSAAATDIYLQTVSSNGGQTAVAGSQSTVSAANSQKYQTVATIAYTGSEAVTEWGLHSSATRTATTGSPFTATTSTGATVTGTPLTASSSTVQGKQGFIVVPGTTAVWGLIYSNTTGGLTIPAWYKVSDGTAGSTPGSTEAYTFYPVLWDHKVFSAINVVSGDSIQFTYTLTVTSGG